LRERATLGRSGSVQAGWPVVQGTIPNLAFGIPGRAEKLISLKAEQWRRQVDVIVVGSGRAARTAAIRVHDWGAMVLLVEKYERFGGTVGFPAA
jgi:hypothetical protein